MIELNSEHRAYQIDWMYPNIYPNKEGGLSSIEIMLSHTRASDSILIEFDGDRNGYVIRMDKTKDMGNYSEEIEHKVEVAFIPAWNEVDDLPEAN